MVDDINKHYTIGQQNSDILGIGAFGTVRICTNTNGDKFAIKLIEKQLIDGNKIYK